MKFHANGVSRMVMLVVLGAFVAGSPLAQTTTVDERNFEVISVDGNKIVFRDQRGTQELTVPDDFRFTIDGKKVAASELKPGMKGTALVTTTTTIRPVVVTEVRDGEVLRINENSVTVRQGDGTRRWSQGQLDAKGVQIYKDGQPIRVADLKRGDKLTAVIVTQGPPVVLTEQEVTATLADAAADATKMAAATTSAPPAAGAAPKAAAAPSGAMAPAAGSAGSNTMWYVIIAALIAVALIVFLRRRKQQ